MVQYVDVGSIVPSDAARKTLRIDGVDHDMVQPTVEDLLEEAHLVERMSKKPPTTLEIIEGMIRKITKAFPTVTREQVVKMTSAQWKAVSALIDASAEAPDDVKDALGNAETAAETTTS
jgi:hypothetical protein